jgi:CBS domain containing-hemolysin-like protein
LEDGSGQGFFHFIQSLIKKKIRLGNSNDLADEIHDLMDEGQAKGLITNEESHMVYGVLDLKETPAHSIMIPRTEVSSAPVDSTLGELIDLVTRCGHTRIPIHKDNIDQIVGILHAKDLLKLLGKDPQSKIPTDILRRPFFVPESRRVSDLLKDMQERTSHLAIVTDEYGGTAGIITIEDILEEIVGEIMDEHDHEETLITRLEDGSLLVDARLDVEKLGEALQMNLPEGEFESVGGFIIDLLGRIPRTNEKVRFQDLEMIIREGDQRRIEQVVVSRVAPAETEKTEASTTSNHT